MKSELVNIVFVWTNWPFLLRKYFNCTKAHGALIFQDLKFLASVLKLQALNSVITLEFSSDVTIKCVDTSKTSRDVTYSSVAVTIQSHYYPTTSFYANYLCLCLMKIEWLGQKVIQLIPTLEGVSAFLYH